MRREPREHVLRYMAGQLSSLERKSAMHIAGGNLRGMQRFISDDVWKEEKRKRMYHGMVADEMGEPQGMLIVAVAKANYDWPGRISKATELMEYFRGIVIQYRHLIDDLNYHKILTPDFETLHLKLRSDSLHAPADPDPGLSDKHRQRIQQTTNNRIDRSSWWLG